MDKAKTIDKCLQACADWGLIPTEFRQCMTWEEQVLWLEKFLKNTVIPTFNANTEAYEELKATVENFFATLDVQEEINNKLDEMAEAGTLADIISQYLNSTAVFAYDTVASMKAATNFVDGSYARTLGYYAKGDKGGALYRIRTITNDDTIDESLLIEITGDPTNTLVAELQLEDKMAVEQFGVKGDNTTDDTAKFQIALDNCKNLACTHSQYKVDHILFKENQTIDGQGAKINCDLATSALVGFASDLTIKNLDIHSNNNDKEWNRLDVRDCAFITFENCTFSGFQQQDVTPGAPGLNVWALYIRECHDIRVINCNFVDNNFQDVLIEFDCKNIYFENCTGSYNNVEGFYVDIEPSQNYKTNENITFVNCMFRQLHIFEYYNQTDTNKNILVMGCIIKKFLYCGGNISIINSPILGWVDAQATTGLLGDGVLDIKDSIHYSKNLITDPYLKDVSNAENTYWKLYYANGAWSSMAERISDSDGEYLSLNHANNSGKLIFFKSQQISCTPNDVYMLKHLSRAYYKSQGAAGVTAHTIRIRFYDGDGTYVSQIKFQNNRTTDDTVIPFSERTNIFMIPSGVAKFEVLLGNGDGETTFSADYASVAVYKLSYTSSRFTNVEPLGFGNGKPYYVKQNPSTNKTNKINHFTGERCYYETPSTYIGAVCTDGANNTYKEFGALSS